MLQIFASNERIDTDALLSQLKGSHARQCLDKIVKMNGQIVAIDFSRGQWPDTKGEHIWYATTDGEQAWFCELRTDDSCVSFAAMGNRWANREELIAEVTRNHETQSVQREEETVKAEKAATNLVSA